MSPIRPTKKATPEQALQQLKHFCGFRERCHKEVREKLRSIGIWGADQEEILSKLIEEDYLNEERFARLFSGGKFRVNKWGRNRIRYELKQKRVSDYCIRKGLEEIDEEEYEKVLVRLAAGKYKALTGPDAMRRQKTQVYLMGRGFEPELIKTALHSALSEGE
ncbi:MAG: RecX family transcriptional regulator [Bacteroidetes bacterium]|nr:RecX family transcriptional regulator [Bacteroidota bacterium]